MVRCQNHPDESNASEDLRTPVLSHVTVRSTDSTFNRCLARLRLPFEVYQSCPVTSITKKDRRDKFVGCFAFAMHIFETLTDSVCQFYKSFAHKSIFKVYEMSYQSHSLILSLMWYIVISMHAQKRFQKPQYQPCHKA